MAGGPNGAWNAKEWFPAIVLSGPYLKCLPDIPGSVRAFHLLIRHKAYP